MLQQMAGIAILSSYQKTISWIQLLSHPWQQKNTSLHKQLLQLQQA
jgi:hypothetical protein